LAGGCPVGWSHFDAAAGRFLIGVDGNKYKLPYVAGRPEYQFGGEERVALIEEEMPEHFHGLARVIDKKILDSDFGDDFVHPAGDRKTITRDQIRGLATDPAGGHKGKALAHENMPPFVALYFCKKDK